jgi:hypothetical protein
MSKKYVTISEASTKISISYTWDNHTKITTISILPWPLKTVRVQSIVRFLFNSLDNHIIDRITEKYTITRDTSLILGNPHGGEN